MSNVSLCAPAPVEFQFQSNTVRTVAIDGEVWFCAADVCSVLGYTNSRKVIADHCKASGVTKRYISSGGQNREVIFINEPNLYRLIIRSKKPEAEKFETWVMEEVLPAIRKTGSYSVSINKIQQGELATLIAERFPSGKDRPYAWSRLNNHFRLASYKDLPANRFGEACEYIKTMQDDRTALPSVPNLLDRDYFAKVRDIANKFIDDWSRVHKGEDVNPTLTIPDDVLAGIIAQQLSRQNFRLFVDYAGQLHVDPIPNKSPYEGLAEAIADQGNTGLKDEIIQEIGEACVKALAYRAQQRKAVIGKMRGAK